MGAALAFYQDVLQFQVIRRDPNYSIVGKDHGRLTFRLAGGGAVPSREVYVEVAGIEALWEHVRQFKGEYRIRDLFA